MPSQKGKRAKGVQMTEQQPKTPQIIDIVEMLPTADIVQSPPTQNGSQTPNTAQIEDILQMAAHMVLMQSLKRALGGNIYLELTEWNGSKRVDLRLWKDGTVPTKEGVSLHLDQWKALCNMSDVINDLLTSVIENEPVEWRYHIGNDVFVTIKAPFPFVHSREHCILPMNGSTSYQERCGFTLWRMERTETDHPIVGRKRARTETVSSLI